MSNAITNELQIQTQIDEIKSQFAETKDIYREVCVLLFFRYGITPTANKLYQYVRRGSMSAPAEALNKFWLELRDKSRVRIERSDIPENISQKAGDLVASLWNEAQKGAQAGFSELIDNATAEILKYKLQSEVASQKLAKVEITLIETLTELKNVSTRLSEAENLRQVDIVTLGDKEKALQALQNEYGHLKCEFTEAKKEFSTEITKFTNLMNKSDERFKSHESKYLLEIDRIRQKALSLQKELNKSNVISKTEQSTYIKEIANLNKANSVLNNKVGLHEGQIVSLRQDKTELTKQVKILEKKLQKYFQKK